jgi:hypothetical protein
MCGMSYLVSCFAITVVNRRLHSLVRVQTRLLAAVLEFLFLRPHEPNSEQRGGNPTEVD